MFHCIACNKPVSVYHNFCDECEEQISFVYSDDTIYLAYLKGIHPNRIPLEFLSINFGIQASVDDSCDSW